MYISPGDVTYVKLDVKLTMCDLCKHEYSNKRIHDMSCKVNQFLDRHRHGDTLSIIGFQGHEITPLTADLDLMGVKYELANDVASVYRKVTYLACEPSVLAVIKDYLCLPDSIRDQVSFKSFAEDLAEDARPGACSAGGGGALPSGE